MPSLDASPETRAEGIFGWREFCTAFQRHNLPPEAFSCVEDAPEKSSTSESGNHTQSIWPRRRPRSRNVLLLAVVGFMLVFISLQTICHFRDAVAALWHDKVDWVLDRCWFGDQQDCPAFTHLRTWPSDERIRTQPIACHSHNDEWRDVPLYSAVKAGCISVEADAWLFDGEVYTGHNPSEWSPDRTLRKLYLNPLLDLLQTGDMDVPFQANNTLESHGQVGLFPAAPSQSLVLMIDFKTSGPALWDAVNLELEALRDSGALTFFNGTDIVQRPITVVASGRAPFDLITRNQTYRDIFFDAPLDEMASVDEQPATQHEARSVPTTDLITQPLSQVSGDERDADISASNFAALSTYGQVDQQTERYGPSNSYFASVAFSHSIGRIPWGSRLTEKQMDLIRLQIKGAHQRGLKARYWDLPTWPIGLRDRIWEMLLAEGIDLLNVDDLDGASRVNWSRRQVS